MKILRLIKIAFAFSVLFLLSNCSKEIDLVEEQVEKPSKIDARATKSAERDRVVRLFKTAGRKKDARLIKVNSKTSLPSGVSIDVSKKNRNRIIIKGSRVTLENFDFRGYWLDVQATNVVIRNNVFTETKTGFHKKHVIKINASTTNFRIENNDFNGFKGASLGASSAIKQEVQTSPKVRGLIKGNRFKHQNKDVIKTSGGVIIEDNVLYAVSNVAYPPKPYNRKQTYRIGDVVQGNDGKKQFISTKNSNRGKRIPSVNGKSNSFWNYYDPHVDFINPYANAKESTIRRNLIFANPQDARIPKEDRAQAVGITNAFRIVRNNGKGATYRKLNVYGNVVLGAPLTGGYVPTEISNSDKPNSWTSPVFKNNFLDKNKSGKYFYHKTTAKEVDLKNNRDATSLKQIKL